MAKTLAEVEDDIKRNLAFLLENAPTDDMLDAAKELAGDLESTQHIIVRTKYQKRGRELNRLAQRNAALERENRVFRARMSAIVNLVTFDPS